jgi:UDP-N-acetylglucosamine--N-acetylmuramyl-(pentapeptide) pyrophosphoryl-undecaprenol N-acetylglucosamine transferase
MHAATKPITDTTALHAVSMVIAGGGTGGHLFPGIAMAEELLARDPANRVLFLGTGRAIENRVLPALGFQHRTIRAAGLKGQGLFQKARALIKIPQGIWDAIRILRQFQPSLVMGVGGYSAGPVAIGAWLMRIKIALHEQNILPGLTNRLLAYLAQRIYISFDGSRSHFSARKVRHTGNPVRREIWSAAAEDQRPVVVTQGGAPSFRLLVLGGSQGAHRINQAVVEALRQIEPAAGLQLVHQTGDEDEHWVRDAYQRMGHAATVRAFFQDMAHQYQRADLIICRAGATTLAEITVMGKASLLIPYPFAADNHQQLNAQTLVDAGAAEMILEKDLRADDLQRRLTHWMMHPATLKHMSENARHMAMPHAARDIISDCYQMLSSTRPLDVAHKG